MRHELMYAAVYRQMNRQRTGSAVDPADGGCIGGGIGAGARGVAPVAVAALATVEGIIAR